MTKFKAGDKFIPRKPEDSMALYAVINEHWGKVFTVNSIENEWVRSVEYGYRFHRDWCEKVEENHIPEVRKMVESSETPNGQERVPDVTKMVDWEQREWDASVAAMQAISTAIFSNREAAATMLKRSESENLGTMELIMKISIENAKELVKQFKGE